MSSTKDSFSLCFYVTQVLNPDLACLNRASQTSLCIRMARLYPSPSITQKQKVLSAVTWDSIHRILKPALWNLFRIIPSNRHIIWNTPFLTFPLNLNRLSTNCLLKNDNYIEFSFRQSSIFKDWLNTSNTVDMLVAGTSMVGR